MNTSCSRPRSPKHLGLLKGLVHGIQDSPSVPVKGPYLKAACHQPAFAHFKVAHAYHRLSRDGTDQVTIWTHHPKVLEYTGALQQLGIGHVLIRGEHLAQQEEQGATRTKVAERRSRARYGFPKLVGSVRLQFLSRSRQESSSKPADSCRSWRLSWGSGNPKPPPSSGVLPRRMLLVVEQPASKSSPASKKTLRDGLPRSARPLMTRSASPAARCGRSCPPRAGCARRCGPGASPRCCTRAPAPALSPSPPASS